MVALADAQPGQVVQIVTPAEWEEVLKSELVIVDFTATWCGPCRMIAPIYEGLAQKFPNIKFVKVDVDENAEVAKQNGISAMPTFKAFKNGQPFGEAVMGANPPAIEQLVSSLASS